MELSPHVHCLVQAIASLCSPEQIYLYHVKVNLENQVTSFKLCIIADTMNKAALERDIYLNLDCELPYDLVLYTPEEWESFIKKPHSFASEIYRKGVRIYDKTPAPGQSL